MVVGNTLHMSQLKITLDTVRYPCALGIIVFVELWCDGCWQVIAELKIKIFY